MPMSFVIRPTLLSKDFFEARLFNVTVPRTTKNVIHRAFFVTVKCTTNNGSPEQSFNLKDALKDAVGDSIEELLKKEENKGLLDGLEKASMRVENAKRELAEIERQEIEAMQARAYIDELEKRASEIAECQKEISEAREMVDEAEKSLLGTIDRSDRDEEISKNRERIESVKAASIAAIVGTLAGLPITIYQASDVSQLILPLAINIASCALFGVTYRYTIRRDIDDIHLKSGAWAAFGVVKGLGVLSGGQPLELSTESLLSHAFEGATYVSLNLFIFVSAAVGLDYCFKVGLLSPFPIQRPTSETEYR